MADPAKVDDADEWLEDESEHDGVYRIYGESPGWKSELRSMFWY